MTNTMLGKLLLIAPGVCAMACAGENRSGRQSLDIAPIVRGDLRITVREQGEIQAARNTRVSSKLEGRSTVIYLIPEGSVVAEGDRLVELDVSAIEDKRATQAITVAKADAALEQARKNFEILERQLEASEEAAQSRLEIAEMRLDKFLGVPPRGRRPLEGGREVGTNAQMVTALRDLLNSETLANDAAELNYADLVDEVVEILGGDASLGLQMGDLANQVLRQIEQIAQARAKLVIDEETFRHSETLYAKEFITKNERDRDRLTYEGQLSNVMLAWNDLELLIRFTLKETKITLLQEVRNARLDLDSVRATNEATRVRERAELMSKEAEFELATERLENWDQQIRNGVITAPTPGLVVYAREGGGMGRPRDPIMEGTEVFERQAIINLPDVTTMIAEIKVHEAQINRVAVGQPATIRVDAFPERFLTGQVTRVANVPDSGSMWTNNDLKVYQTTVTLEGRNEDQSLRPGMTATVEIHVGVLRDALIAPLPALERAGNVHYVWKHAPEGPIPVRVEVGINNPTHFEVAAGLVEGDLVYMSTPTGVEAPEFDQAPEAGNAVPEAPDLRDSGAAVDAGLRGGGGGPRDGGSGAAGMASGMQSLSQLRNLLSASLPEYRDRLTGDDWFRVLGDPDFQRAMEAAAADDPALRTRLEGLQGMMQGMGRGRGRRPGRDGSRGRGDGR